MIFALLYVCVQQSPRHFLPSLCNGKGPSFPTAKPFSAPLRAAASIYYCPGREGGGAPAEGGAVHIRLPL